MIIQKKNEYGRKRSLSNYILAVDAKSKKAVSFQITRGNVHDAKKILPSSKRILRNIILTKYTHDNRNNFNLQDKM
ncbi:MAG: hypothetical protein WAM14_27110 [Candidatus Nitrosopolaris sp.]